jgi:hypothetical protein
MENDMKSNKLQDSFMHMSMVFVISVLCACAPSGDDDSSAITASSESVQSNTEIDRDFDLRSTNPLEVTVAKADPTAGEGYLSICRHKEQQGKSVIDYENCLLRTRLSEAPYVGSLKLPAHYASLYAALWFYDIDMPPVIVKIPEADIDAGAVYLEL